MSENERHARLEEAAVREARVETSIGYNYRGAPAVERIREHIAGGDLGRITNVRSVFYCGYALLYMSRVNAKGDAVRDYYTAVHPLLRLALSTWVLVDPDIVITDTRRAREDYPRMKLPVNETSLHYRQADGWVHAVDLRTARRGWLRSRLGCGSSRESKRMLTRC